jgi:hypothetical protein
MRSQNLMPRRQRLQIAGLPVHIVQHGNTLMRRDE